MDYLQLGSSTLHVSRIGFGCMSLPTDEQESVSILHEAIDLGINILDTADIYNDGLNEIIVGKAIKGRRDKIVVASKAGNVRRNDGGLDWNPSKQHILKCADESLKRLKIDYIDLYQLHGGTIHDNIDESIEAFEILKSQGKIRFYGISSIRPNVIREYINRSSIVSVMTQYSLLDRRPEEETLDALSNNGVGVLVRGSVAQGLLIDKPAKKYLTHSEADVAKAARTIREVLNRRTESQAAIQFVLQHTAVTSSIVGIRTLQQLRDIAGTTNAPDLTDEEMSVLKNSISPIKYAEHR